MLNHHKNRSYLPLDTFMTKSLAKRPKNKVLGKALLPVEEGSCRKSQGAGVSPRSWNLYLHSSCLCFICFFSTVLFIISMSLEVKICFFFLLQKLSINWSKRHRLTILGFIPPSFYFSLRVIFKSKWEERRLKSHYVPKPGIIPALWMLEPGGLRFGGQPK